MAEITTAINLIASLISLTAAVIALKVNRR